MNGFNLASTTLCQGLSQAEVKALARFFVTKDYNFQDKIFTQGKVRDKLIVIANGSVKLETEVAGQLELIASFKEGDLLGEMALLNKEIHKHSLVVDSPRLQTWELSVYNWQKIMEQHPKIADKIFQNIAVNLKDRLDHANNKLVTLFASGKIIASYNNLPEIAENILATVIKVIPVNKALFITHYENMNKLIVQHSFGYKNIKQGQTFDLNTDQLLNKLSLEPETKIFDRHDWPKEYIKLPYASNSIIITPIKIRNKVLGFIILGDKLNNRDFTENNRILLEALASQTAPAIEDARLLAYQSSEEDLRRVYIDPFAA